MTEQPTVIDMPVAEVEQLAGELGGEFGRLVTEGLCYIRKEQEANPDVQWNPQGPFDVDPEATRVVTPVILRDGVWIRMLPNEKGHY